MIFRVGHDRGFLGRNQRGPFAVNRHPFHAAVGVVSPGGLGILNDFSGWNSVFEYYLRDELTEAMNLALEIGVGPQAEYSFFLAMLEAELAVSEGSEIESLGNGVELEVDPGQVSTAQREEIGKTLLGEVYSAGRRLPPASGSLLVTILEPGALLPSVAFQEGFYAAKHNLGKLCLPAESTEDPVVLGRRIRRGMAYHVGAQRTADTADAWLLEAMTTLCDAQYQGKSSYQAMSPRELNLRLEGAGNDDNLESWQDARALAAFLGGHALATRTMEELGKLLDAHVEKGWGDLLPHADSSPTDRALRRAWKTSSAELLTQS
jgi:hypothetical protein